MDDPALVERLMKASSPNENGKIAFTKVLPKKNSPSSQLPAYMDTSLLLFLWDWRGLYKKDAAIRDGRK